MRTFRRHMHRRIMLTTGSLLAGLVLIGLLVQLAPALNNMSGLSVPDLLIYLGFSTPEIVANILPLCLYIGTLVTYNFARRDNEITAIQVAGISPWTLTRIALRPALLVAALQMSLNLWATPIAKNASYDFLRANAAKALAGLEEGQFISPLDGLTIRYGQVSGTVYSEVFAHYAKNPGGTTSGGTTYVAQRAVLNNDDDSPLTLVMYDGMLFSAGDASGQRTLSFDQYSLDLSGLIEGGDGNNRKPATLYTHELLAPPATLDHSSIAPLHAEFHYRLASPLIALLLAIFAALAVVGSRIGQRNIASRITLFSVLAVFILLLPRTILEVTQTYPSLNWLHYGAPLFLALFLHITHSEILKKRLELSA